MPVLSTALHSKPYFESSATPQTLVQIKLVLDSIRGLEIDPRLKKRMLVHGLWEVCKATGNFYSRYRSGDVVSNIGLRVQRDHIFKKTLLVAELLRLEPDIDAIMARANCCVVSVDEHRRLHSIDKQLNGWDRYRAAGIVVHDMLDSIEISKPTSRAGIIDYAGVPMVSYETEFLTYVAGKKSASRYVKFLHGVSETTGRDITPQTLRTEQDIESFASALSARYVDKSVRNYRSVMRAYVHMVRDLGL